MIPTRDDLFVYRGEQFDEWGEPIEPTPKQYKARIDYRNEKVMNDNGEEVISKATILVKGIADIKTSDLLKWTDALGTKQEAFPISVSPLKNIGGRNVIFTKVVI